MPAVLIIMRYAAANVQSTCVEHCADKFLKHSERVGARFAEHNAGESPRHDFADLSRTDEAVGTYALRFGYSLRGTHRAPVLRRRPWGGMAAMSVKLTREERLSALACLRSALCYASPESSAMRC